MHIERLYADRFRNLAAVEMHPHARFNVLSGDNGQGKTNVLEAIWLLSGLRSFRTRKLGQCVHFDAESAELGARVQRQGVKIDIGVRLGGKRNTVFVDGKQQARGKDYLGQLVAVLFTPDDLRLPHGEPEMRRKYLDRAIWSHDPAFLVALRNYEKVLSNRNALLRNHVGRTIDMGMLDVFDDMLCNTGAILAHHRQVFVSTFQQRVQDELAAFGPGDLTCGLLYRPKHARRAGDLDERKRLLSEELTARHDSDRRRGFTSVGPHLDDLELQINGRIARTHASQGQCRALILAMKIAELRSPEETHGEPPVLLMDDVSSELDKRRNAALMGHLDALGGQVFLTTTDASHILVTAPTAIFDVVAGEVTAREGSASDATLGAN